MFCNRIVPKTLNENSPSKNLNDLWNVVKLCSYFFTKLINKNMSYMGLSSLKFHFGISRTPLKTCFYFVSVFYWGAKFLLNFIAF